MNNLLNKTYINFRIDNIDKAAQNDDEIEDVPRVPKIIL